MGEPRVLHESERGGAIPGIATTSSHLYFVRDRANHVKVLDKENFDERQQINIPGLTQASGLAACQDNNCLYVSDAVSRVIHRVDLSTNAVTTFSVSGEPCGISLTRKHNCNTLIVTLWDTKTIAEYTTEGMLLREIRLDESIKGPQHCAELSTGQFVVCQWDGTHHGVVIVDANGAIVMSYGGPIGSPTRPRYGLRGLAVDTSDNILVADSDNHKVQLISSTLTHLRDVRLSNRNLRDPYSVHLDEFSDRLYIGEGGWGSGNDRLFVLDRSTV